MPLPPAIVVAYHPRAVAGAAAVIAVLTAPALVHAWPVPAGRCWPWSGGAFALGQLIFWADYLSGAVSDEALQRVHWGERRSVSVLRRTLSAVLWRVLLSLACYGALVVAADAGSPFRAVILIGVSTGLLAGLPWSCRRWRRLKEAYLRAIAPPRPRCRPAPPGSVA